MKLTFKQAMDADILASKLIPKGGRKAANEAAFARNILREDLEEIGDDDGWRAEYGLEDRIRDRLIAHARQDAALACVSITGLRTEIKSLRRLLWAVVAISCVILFKLSY